MCLYPRLIQNKKYQPNKKNGGLIERPEDMRLNAVPIGCGQCEECRKQKSRQWQVRLQEEIKTNTNGKFVTLTFNNESLEELYKEAKTTEDHTITTLAIRRFLERWRKATKKSVKHWLIDECGHKGTERLHIHGLLFTDQDSAFIKKIWKYGFVFIGEYVNAKTINYIVKYITKKDEHHDEWIGKLHVSSGIGNNYKNKWDFEQAQYKPSGTNEYYRLNNGQKINLPIYYRNMLYSEEQREELWKEKLNKKERYILGKKYKIETPEEIEIYLKALEHYRQESNQRGYKVNLTWNKEKYLNQLTKINNSNLDNII